jgi:hypothetical protein
MGSPDEVEFGFDTSQLDAFDLDESPVAEAPAVANNFDFSLDDDAVMADPDFSFDDALDEPTAMADFDLDDALASETIVANDFDLDAALDESAVRNDFSFDDDEFALDEPIANEPDWLAAMDDSAPIEATVDDEPDWLANVGVGGVAVAGAAVADALTPNEDEDAQPLEEFAEEFAAPTRQSVPADEATNAPDWLNSMVPGLDVNYENLPQNDIVEEEFNEGTSLRGRNIAGFTAVNDGYEWLEDIVEEETNGMAPITDAPPPPPLAPLPNFSRAAVSEVVAEAPTRRFVFSRPPAWLNALKEAVLGKPDATADSIDEAEFDDFADFDFDDDDDKK